MVRLLIIGRNAEAWRGDLAAWEGERFEVDAESLPSAGVRNFSETSPDAVAIAEPDGSPRIEPIAKALQDQPLGQLVPILTLEATYRGDEDLAIAAEVGASAGAEGLVERLEELLEVDLEPTERYAETKSSSELRVETDEASDPTLHSTEIPTRRADEGAGDDESFAREVAADRRRAEVESKVERPDYVLEPVDDEGDEERAEGPAATSSSESRRPPANAEAIRRKLDQIRHEDYFAILEVSRSAESDEVRAAYRREKARFRRERLPDELVERHESDLAEIDDALDDARAVLGDEELRRAYLAAME